MRLGISLLSAALACAFSFTAAAKGQFESADFSLVEQKAYEVRAQSCDVAHTLVVLDIDNTLLTTKQDLGGDAWFNWQVTEITNHAADAAAADINGLVKVQSQLFGLSGMRVVDDQNPLVVKRLQDAGFPVIALTSRGLENHDATLRELLANGYHLEATAIGPKGGIAGRYLPYDLNDLEKSGLSADDVTRFKLGAASDVMFAEGVFFGAGQHKGAMLKALLHKTGFVPCGIVFADDTPSNVQKVWAAFGTGALDVDTIRYAKIDPEVQRFNGGDKGQVTQQLATLKQTLAAIFQ